MSSIKKRLQKLEREKGVGDPLFIIIDKCRGIALTSEERAVLDDYVERMAKEAKAGGMAVVVRSREKAQELLALADKNKLGREDEGT